MRRPSARASSLGALLAAQLLVVGLALTGCSGGSGSDQTEAGTGTPSPVGAPAPSGASETADAVEEKPAVDVRIAVRGVDRCVPLGDRQRLGIALFDFSWRARARATILDARLIDPVGVTQIGAARSFPARPGVTRLTEGGEATWDAREEVYDTFRDVDPARADVVDGLRVRPGDRGLFELHLSYDPLVDLGSYGGLKVTYREPGADAVRTAEVRAPSTLTVTTPQRRCPGR